MKIVVIGGMNLDLLGFPGGPPVPRDSTPGRICLRPGGVGRNIAARLKQMGAEVSLITALGQDERAGILAASCEEGGIDLSRAVKTSRPSPCYLCIHDEKGDMALAVNDMSAMEELTKDALESRLDFINTFDACVLDANLPSDALQWIAAHATPPLMLDPVSSVKAPRALPILPYLTLIKPNLLEARALTGEGEADRAAEKLLSAGVKNVFISLGEGGVYYANKSQRGLVPSLPLPFLPLTGAGDALCAGLVKTYLEGWDILSCAQAGCRAAYEALIAQRGKI